MGSFRDVEPAVDALDRLRALGISDHDIAVFSSPPYSHEVLGRPAIHTRLPIVSLVSAVLGFLTGVFFVVITPYLYVIRVGGQPIVPTPPTAVLLYEFTMLFLIVGTFIGLIVLKRSPEAEPEYYDPKVNDGRISLLVHVPKEKKLMATVVMQERGAEDIHDAERRAP
jgi:hypothetical protein